MSGVLNRALYIDPSQSGKPVPTNEWWTDLIISRYSGDLWARPFTVSANANGVRISYPKTWNSSGTAFELGTALEISGDVEPVPDASDIVMADFEAGYPAGWTRNGNAFPATPAQGTLPGQSMVSAYLGTRLANSFNGGDGPTGSLVSPDFTVDRSYIAFLVGGGNHPGVAEVRLVIGDSTVLSATGLNSEQLRWVNWDVSAYAGQTARIEVVDNATGGWGHILADQIIRTNSTENPGIRFATSFRPDSAQALRWGDWNVAFRMPQLSGAKLDVSLARGVPFVWLETDGVKPTLRASGAEYLTAAGIPVNFPVTTDRFVMKVGDKAFGIHAPDNSTFTLSNGAIHSDLGADYLVFSALPAVADLDAFHARAFAVARDTRVSWNYSATDGEVTTSWEVDTVALEGSNLDTIQGWLPHHYRGTAHNLSFEPGMSYATPRGPMKCTIGRSGWEIGYGFEGLSPGLPLPKALGKPNDFDPAILKKYLDDYAGETGYGGDTYWGGKSLTQLADYMLMAKQAGEAPAYDALKDSLRTALTDWFTYEPGETEHYFARYANWGAIVGFNDSYGSHEFVDHHFHYGYFTRAAGLLAFEDPDFLAGYGEMATLVAKQYANWDREDPNFPFMRTFDLWGGHSYAGGFSSPGGNNQESSSEAMQSWAGLFMLGSALGNEEMRDAGAMGYVMERAAVREYWLDVHEDILPPTYEAESTGILFDSGQAYATYFSGDPAWIYGIQWLPAATHLSYLGWDPEFSKSLMAAMIDERPVILGRGVAGGSRYSLWESRQSWYGIHDNALNQNAAIADMKNAINNAYHHNPGYVTALNAANPLYNSATGTLYVTVNTSGTLDYPAAYWTPATLPAALIPPNANPATPAEEPVSWSLWQYLGVETNYQVDPARMSELYRYDVLGYDASETSQAADVYSRMGDGLGNVVLGFAAQYDPDFYADVHAELWERNDPVAKAKSMAGIVYYEAYSNRGLGVPDPSRHTSIPTSQAYRNPETGAYRYVVYNPSESEQTVTVYGAAGALGSFPVPAKTLLNHGLDQQLESLVITPSNPARTIVPGETVQFTVTGYDQYGGTSLLGAVSWSVSGGGSINAAGLFNASNAQDPVTVTVTTGGKTASYVFRVGTAPVLTNLAVSPEFIRVAVGGSVSFTASGLDQYGDPIAAGGVTWTTDVSGAMISPAGVFAGTSIGTGRVIASSGGHSGSALVSVQAAQQNIAFGKTATASTNLGGNTAPKAVDGNAGTRWESIHADGQWLQIDLGAVYDLSSMRVDWEPAYASSYRVQISDSENGPWSTIREVAKLNANDDEFALSGTGRFVRLDFLSRGTVYGFSIFELEIRGWLAGSAVTPAAVHVIPGSVTVQQGQTQAFQAFAFNANGEGGPVSNPAWSVSGGGTIDAAGIFTANSVGGPFTVSAGVGSVSGSGMLSVIAGSAGGAYESWSGACGLNGASSSKSADADGDGRDNLTEFALDGVPLSGGNDGKIVSKLATLGGESAWTLTLPVRNGASFGGSAAKVSALIDGVIYRVQGSANLASYPLEVIEVTGANAVMLQSGMPELSTGWVYRSFRLAGTTVAGGRGFIRVTVSEG
ncbi:glycosyl hydrolase [Luteolibacter rhizosphaerae]|uniref:glycosyl hydrolase n=1 Tax=Luteolibacter rhizosphaerae TaxID=2989719 RepID=UPI002222CB98|nr:glycosyl hydrolase [Luteolibacter rhizosphaerae]